MKLSSYNHFVSIKDKVICYNAFTDSYIICKKEVAEVMQSEYFCVDNLSDKMKKTFLENGFIINDDFDERQAYLNARFSARFTSDTYEIIVNPTMDCNLGCWYCYESHVSNSCMPDKTIDAIRKHIILQHNKTNFKQLYLSFFGGEPLKCIDVVYKLIDYVEQLSAELNFELFLSFTTNGTLVTDKFLDRLKNLQVHFQITLDGYEDCHNRIRKLKSTGAGTYRHILETINKIINFSGKFNVTLRINLSAATVSSIESLTKDIQCFSKYKNFSISLHKVWQVDVKKFNEKAIMNFVSRCQTMGMVCNYLNLDSSLCSCYADCYNEVVINYDGLVFKCTARPFTKENSYGHILSDGNIVWNTKRLLKRLSVSIPTIA